jgi:hypothetical protein
LTENLAIEDATPRIGFSAIMIVIPYARTTISTDLSSENIRERFLTLVGPNKEFRGKLTDNGFRLRRRNPSWSNDEYRPVIRGKFSSSSTGTCVRLSFWVSPLVLTQGAAFFVFVQYLAVSKHEFMWFPVSVFSALHVGLCCLSFIPGLRWAERRLRQVLAA